MIDKETLRRQLGNAIFVILLAAMLTFILAPLDWTLRGHRPAGTGKIHGPGLPIWPPRIRPSSLGELLVASRGVVATASLKTVSVLDLPRP